LTLWQTKSTFLHCWNCLQTKKLSKYSTPPVKILTGAVPSPVFDSQIAASVCGYGDSISYDKLVQAIVGAQVDKSSRFTDWAARPSYALADVTHLRDIYLELSKKLKELNRVSWMNDEQKPLLSLSTYIMEPKDAWVRLKSKVNRPRDLAMLKKLAALREQKAQDSDRPRRRVLKDDALYELAIQRPKSPKDFDRFRAVPKGFGNSRLAQEIVALTKQVENIPDTELPSMPQRRMGPSPKGPIGDLLRVLVKAVAEREGVASRIIANSSDIDELVLSDNADIAAMSGWRFELFGKKALALKHGKLGLAASTEGIIEIEIDKSEG